MEAYAADICTVAVNLAGLPALAMPCGVGEDGMPIGLQIIGPAFGDAAVLQAAYTYEQLAWPEGAGRAWRAGKEVTRMAAEARRRRPPSMKLSSGWKSTRSC